MENNRLSLYNDYIYTYLEHNDKIKFRKIAFKNKMSVSEFNRKIILLVIKLDEMKKLNSKKDTTENIIFQLNNMLGGINNF